MEPILMVSSILLWIVVLFNLLLTVALIRRGTAKQSGFEIENVPTLEIGSQAPDFTAETLDGETVTLFDYVGKSVALIFMSPSCPPCVEKLPLIHELAPKANSLGVDLVLVMLAASAETKTFVTQHNIGVPIILAPQKSNPFADNYKVSGTPFYCFLNIDNRVQSSGFFGSDWIDLTRHWLSTE